MSDLVIVKASFHEPVPFPKLSNVEPKERAHLDVDDKNLARYGQLGLALYPEASPAMLSICWVPTDDRTPLFLSLIPLSNVRAMQYEAIEPLTAEDGSESDDETPSRQGTGEAEEVQ